MDCGETQLTRPPVTSQQAERMARKSPAPIWDYFRKDPENEERAICKVVVEGSPCGKNSWAKGGTTTTILRHLKDAHKEEHEGCRIKM